MKITYLIVNAGISGGNRRIFGQINRFVARGHKVRVFSIEGLQPKWFDLKTEIQRLPSNFSSIEELERIVCPTDILIAGSYDLSFLVSKVRHCIPFYFVLHYETLFGEDQEFKKKCDASYHLPLNLICVSSWLKELLWRKFHRQSHRMLTGVDLDVFKPRKPSIFRSREKKLMMIFSPLKFKASNIGLETFRFVWERRGEISQGIQFVIVGLTPPPKTNFPYTFFYHPDLETLCQLYSECDVFLSTSRSEGFARASIEAMACGTPVISTDSGGIREVVFNGETGFIVESWDPRMLSNAIIGLLKNKKRLLKMKKAAREKAEVFTWDIAMDDLENFFLKAVESSAKGDVSSDQPVWKKVLLVFPDDPWAHYCLGLHFYKKGLFPDAEMKFKKALSLDVFPEAYQYLGLVQKQMGNFKESLKNLKRAQELFFKDKDADQTIF
jgi:glycosyltransferase involved in cell wall biosynthesis